MLALACAIGFPFVFTNPATTSIAFFTVLYVAAASAWNLFSGYSGYMALGNAVFYGSGAYFIANVTNHLNLSGGVGIFAWVPVAGLFAGIVAIPVGWLALRTRRAHLRRHHHRDLLHLPAARLQPAVGHERLGRHAAAAAALARRDV